MIAAGMEMGSCWWTMGVSVGDRTGRASVVSMLTVKLKGVGEGMFAELAEDIVGWGRWLSSH